MKNNYIVIREKRKSKTINFDGLNGYNMPRNRVINGITIDNILVVNDVFIRKVINKKIEKKFKKLLEFIASIYESDDDSSSGLMMILNEIEKLRREMINKYIAFLDKKEVQKLDKKIKILEQEAQSKMYQYHELYEEMEDDEEKTSHHRR